MRLHLALFQIHVVETQITTAPVAEDLAIAHHRIQATADAFDLFLVSVLNQFDNMLKRAGGGLLIDQVEQKFAASDRIFVNLRFAFLIGVVIQCLCTNIKKKEYIESD